MLAVHGDRAHQPEAAGADLLLHFCHMFRGHASFGPQGVGHVAVEQQPELSHLQHDQSHQLTLVHPTDHLLEAARNTQKWYNRVGSRSTASASWRVWLQRTLGLPLHVFPLVVGGGVDVSVKLSDVIVQGAVVAEGRPLRVHAHAALVSLDQVNVTQLLHVAGVGASACTQRRHESCPPVFAAHWFHQNLLTLTHQN